MVLTFFFLLDQCLSWPVSKLLQQVALTPWQAPSPASSLHRRFVFHLSQGKQSPEILWVRSVTLTCTFSARFLCWMMPAPGESDLIPPQRSRSRSYPGPGTNLETPALQSGPENLPFRLCLHVTALKNCSDTAIHWQPPALPRCLAGPVDVGCTCGVGLGSPSWRRGPMPCLAGFALCALPPTALSGKGHIRQSWRKEQRKESSKTRSNEHLTSYQVKGCGLSARQWRQHVCLETLKVQLRSEQGARGLCACSRWASRGEEGDEGIKYIREERTKVSVSFKYENASLSVICN